MKNTVTLILLGACILCAQTPNYSGVWKVNLEKSKLGGGPSPSSYLVILDQQGSKLSEKVGVVGPRGEQRSSFTWNTDETPAMNSWLGSPMSTKASWDGGTLILNSRVAGSRGGTVTEKYTLSPDGNTLTVERVLKFGARDIEQTLVLEKQPDSAGDALRKPEETAGVHFKNVQLLKDVPASQFIDVMRYFTMALGVECQHCHVEGKFEADDKPAKVMARKMIIMTHSANEQTFGGRMEVRCYTCHRGQKEPQSAPGFN